MEIFMVMRRMLLVWVVIAGVGFCSSINAETLTWDGGQTPRRLGWQDKENWSPLKRPNAGDRVILPAGAKPILDIESTVKELLMGGRGVGQDASIVGADQSLSVTSLTVWNNGVLTRTGSLDLSESSAFSGRAHFDEWVVTVNGAATAVNTSFRTGRSLTIAGDFTVGSGTSFGGTKVGQLILNGVLNMNAQTGSGDPPGSTETSSIDSVLLNHQGTLRADRGKWIIGSPVLSVSAATTATGPLGEIEFRGGGQFGLSEVHRFEPAPNTRIRLTGVTRPYQLGTVENMSSNTPVLIENTTLQSGTFSAGRWEFDAETSSGIGVNGGRWDWRGGTIRERLDIGTEAELVLGAKPSGKAIQLVGRGLIMGSASQFRNVSVSTNLVIQGRWTMHNFASLVNGGQGKVQVMGELKHTAFTATQRSEIGIPVESGQGAGIISNEGGVLNLSRLVPSGMGEAYTFVLNEGVDLGAPAKTILSGVVAPPDENPSGSLRNTLFAFKERGGTFELATDVTLAGNTVVGIQESELNPRGELVIRKGTVELSGRLTGPSRFDGEKALEDRIRSVLGLREARDASFIIDDSSSDLSKPTMSYSSNGGSGPSLDMNVDWRRGLIRGEGSLPNTSLLTLSGSGVKRFGRAAEAIGTELAVLLNRGGEITFLEASRLELGAFARLQNGLSQPFTNIPQINFNGDASIVMASGVSNAEFVNNGRFLKTNGDRTSLVNVPFSNFGSVTCGQGRLKFSGPVAQVRVVNPNTGEIELDGQWRATGGMIQFAQDKVLKLTKVTDLVAFSGKGSFLNHLGEPLIDSKANLTSTGNVIIERDSSIVVDRLEQTQDFGRSEPELSVAGGLKGKELRIGAGTVEVGPMGKLEFPLVLIEPNNDEFPFVIIDGEIVPRADLNLAPLVRVRGGLFGGNGNVGSPLELGSGATLSPGKSPGILRTTQIEFQAGSRYRWEVSDWSGLAGEQSDLISASGDIRIQATPDDPLIIEIVTLTSEGEEGAATGWSPSERSEWTILETTASLFEFSPEAIRVIAPPSIGGDFVVASQGGCLKLIYRAFEDPYLAWQHSHFPPEALGDPGKVGEEADFDRDGIANAIEFVLNSDPTQPNLQPSLKLERTSEGLKIAFDIRQDPAPFSVVLESSSSLDSWQELVRQDPGDRPKETSEREITIDVHRDGLLNTVLVVPVPGRDFQFFRLSVERDRLSWP